MLISLRFQNITLFGTLEIDFHKGFTAFTGETGSGKSIFIDTLNALLVNKKAPLNNRLVKKGSTFSSIEGVFSVFPSIEDWLINQGFELDEDLIVTREWRLKDSKYKSRFRVNGILVNREQISKLRSLLLDFTLQGDVNTLNDSSHQLYLLDCLGFDKAQRSILNVNNAWKKWHNSNLKLIESKEKVINIKQEYLEMQSINEDLEKLQLEDPTEDIKLERDQNRLANLLRLKEGVNSVLMRLNESLDEYPSLLDHTNFCLTELKSLSKIDADLQPILDNFCTLTSDFDNLISEIKAYEMTLDLDPSLLNNLQYRLATLRLYQKKYQKTIPELINYKDEVLNYLSFHKNSNNLDELISAEKNHRQTRDKLNQELSTLRKKTAKELEDKLINTFKELGMPNARFKVIFEETNPSVDGFDRVNFLFSANPGFALAPLAEIASGGEKSRVLLAIKAFFASFDDNNLLVFDEIDSGVSGSVSTSLAKMLHKLAILRQVFCVTHQPLIAAFADNHYAFKKNVVSGQTISTLSNLKEIADRQKELALLAGGEIIEANAYAASLLEHKAA